LHSREQEVGRDDKAILYRWPLAKSIEIASRGDDG